MLFLVVTEAADLFSGPLFPSGSDVSEASRSSKIKILTGSCSAIVLSGANICVKITGSATDFNRSS